MSILDRLTVVPLLYASGGLLAACIALGVWVAILKSNATADAALLGAVSVERDSWKSAAGDYYRSSEGWQTMAGAVRNRLLACQGEKKRLEDSNREAQERARKREKEARDRASAAESRYTKALQDPACGLCVDAPICPALVAP